MSFRSDALTLLPSLCLFLLSSYVAVFALQTGDSPQRTALMTIASIFFLGGLVLAFCWFYYWGISKRLQKGEDRNGLRARYLSNLISLSLVALGSIALVWVGQLTWHDITVWNKDIPLIFFGSRTGENISLGIDMRVIHYSLIGSSLLLLGSVMFLQRKLRKCPYHFGYLASYPRKATVPKKCLACTKVLGCISGQLSKQESLALSEVKEEKGHLRCSHHLGHLRSLQGNQPVPQECVNCLRLLECRNPL